MNAGSKQSNTDIKNTDAIEKSILPHFSTLKGQFSSNQAQLNLYNSAYKSLKENDIGSFCHHVNTLYSSSKNRSLLIAKAKINLATDNANLSAKDFTEYAPSGNETQDDIQIICAILQKNSKPSTVCSFLARLHKIKPLSDIQKHNFSLNVQKSKLIIDESPVMELIAELLKESHSSIFFLSNFISNHLTYVHRLHEKDFDIEGLFKSPFFIYSLDKFILVGTELENAISESRKLITNTVLRQKNASPHLIELMYKISVQEYLNEYFTPKSLSEDQTALALKNIVENAISNNATNSHALPLLILLMYQPPQEIKNISNINRKGLPDFLQKLLTITYDIPNHELTIAEKIPSLTNISDQASNIVRQQYEENPYPKWTHVSAINQKSLGNFLTNMFPYIELSKHLFKPNLHILNAGCGTGLQPISTALSLEKSNFIAIDLSTRSLAYGKVKASQFNLKNIDFFQADILRIDEIDEKFDAIFSTGVLHHMAEPRQGILSLVNVLKDDGVMYLALYSRRAREEISQLRAEINTLNLSPTTQNLSKYKSKVLQEHHGLLKFQDIYSKSMFRDLLFHTHEKTYTWPEIELLMSSCGLEIIAMHPPEGFLDSPLNSQRQKKPLIEDLDNFEKQNPSAFIEMMSFVVKKKQST